MYNRDIVISTAVSAHTPTPESDVIDNGMPPRFHTCCRCPWCATQLASRAVGCEPCKQARSIDPYFHIGRALSKPRILTARTVRNQQGSGNLCPSYSTKESIPPQVGWDDKEVR